MNMKKILNGVRISFRKMMEKSFLNEKQNFLKGLTSQEKEISIRI